MTITSYNDLIAAAVNTSARFPFYQAIDTSTNGTIYSSQATTTQMNNGVTPVLTVPSIPAGKTYLAPTEFTIGSSLAANYMLCRLTNLGSIDISGASGTFTDGSAMATRTEGGTSRQIYGPILMVVTVALNATPGTLTVTYTDQAGNTAAAAAITLTASAAAGTAGFLPLNTGDYGAVDITAATRGAGTTPTGTIRFYGVEMLACVAPSNTPTVEVVNFLTDRVRLIPLAASDTLFIVTNPTTGAKAYAGTFNLIGL